MREAAEVEARIINSNPCRVPGAKGKPAPKHDEPESLSAVELRDYLRAVPERYRVPLMVAAVCGSGTSTPKRVGSRSSKA